MKPIFWLLPFLALPGLAADLPATAGTGSDQAWELHLDETLIFQGHGGFYSRAPDGPNSLVSHAERSYSSVTGIDAGYDFSEDLEARTRIETIRGIPLSNAGGLAGLTNNDMQRIMENRFVSYVALAYFNRSWELGGGTRNASLIGGKVDLLDIFDGNAYAHKSDDQFLNWCFMASCAYDFAADARGYTWGAAGVLNWDDWSTRAGWFALPRLPNQLEIDGSMGQHFQLDWELERRWKTGALKFLAYQGRMKLADFSTLANQSGTFILNAPKTDAKRGGAGLNLQQALSPEVGWFGRIFWTGGRSETMAFTEADRSASTGLSIEGRLWGRALDGVGFGWARNEIGGYRQQFLAAGNYDLFIGDGSLLYAPEQVVETYYKVGILPGVHLTLDWQHLDNPAYNQMRGPVDVYGLRFHAEF